jgi:two-component system, cell cycle sensor histidine kinase and response regulator CckA
LTNLAQPLVQSSLLGEAIDHAPLAIFVADEEMKYVAVNKFACRMLGYSRDELLALRVSDVALSPETPSEYAEMVATSSRAGTSELTRKDGTTVRLRYEAGETQVAGMTLYLAVGWPE